MSKFEAKRLDSQIVDCHKCGTLAHIKEAILRGIGKFKKRKYICLVCALFLGIRYPADVDRDTLYVKLMLEPTYLQDREAQNENASGSSFTAIRTGTGAPKSNGLH